MLKYQLKKLKNGLRVIALPMPHSHLAVINFLVKGGSRYEQKQKMGISHLLEHLLLRGSNKYSMEEFTRRLRKLGGFIDGWTDRENMGLVLDLPSKNINQGIKLLADAILKPRFNIRDIQIERKVIKEESLLKLTPQGEDADIDQLMTELSWPNQPLSQKVLGIPQSIKAITIDDLKNLYEHCFKGRNALMVIGGNIKPSSILSLTEKTFGNLKEGSAQKTKRVKVQQNQPRFKFIPKQESFAQVSIGFRAISHKDKRFWIQEVLQAVLGRGLGSLLFSEIRTQKGLVYKIWAGKNAYSETGLFKISFESEPKNVSEVIKLILQVLTKVKNTSLAQRQIDEAKALVERDIYETLDNLFETSFMVGYEMLFDIYEPPEQKLSQVKQVRPKDIQNFARQIFQPQSLNLVYLGPCTPRQKEEIKKTIKKGLKEF